MPTKEWPLAWSYHRNTERWPHNIRALDDATSPVAMFCERLECPRIALPSPIELEISRGGRARAPGSRGKRRGAGHQAGLAAPDEASRHLSSTAIVAVAELEDQARSGRPNVLLERSTSRTCGEYTFAAIAPGPILVPEDRLAAERFGIDLDRR